jgi:hypothetical protein
MSPHVSTTNVFPVIFQCPSCSCFWKWRVPQTWTTWTTVPQWQLQCKYYNTCYNTLQFFRLHFDEWVWCLLHTTYTAHITCVVAHLCQIAEVDDVWKGWICLTYISCLVSLHITGKAHVTQNITGMTNSVGFNSRAMFSSPLTKIFAF